MATYSCKRIHDASILNLNLVFCYFADLILHGVKLGFQSTSGQLHDCLFKCLQEILFATTWNGNRVNNVWVIVIKYKDTAVTRDGWADKSTSLIWKASSCDFDDRNIDIVDSEMNWVSIDFFGIGSRCGKHERKITFAWMFGGLDVGVIYFVITFDGGNFAIFGLWEEEDCQGKIFVYI